MSSAVILIHGFLSDDEDFAPIIDDLKKRYDYVCRCLIPGHGLNNNLKDFTCEATMKYIEDSFLKVSKDYTTIDLIGFSMGGAISTYLASKYPINRCILLSPANKFLNFKFVPSKIRFFLDYIYLKVKNAPDCPSKEEMDTIMINNRKSFNFAIKRLIPNYNIHTLSTFVNIIKCCNEGFTRIKCPTLLIWGTFDQLVPETTIEYVKNKCDDFKSIIIPEMSHLLLSSANYELVSKEILNFIDND